MQQPQTGLMIAYSNVGGKEVAVAKKPEPKHGLSLLAIANLPKPQLEEKAFDLVRTITLPVALEKGQQLSAALAIPELSQPAKTQVRAMVDDVFRFFGAFEDSASLRVDVTRSILEQFSNLNIEEIALVMKRGKNGDFGKGGKPYGKLNGSHIMYWLTAYNTSDERLGYWERERSHEPKEPDDILSDVLLTLGSRPGPDGIVSVDGSRAEPKEILTRVEQLRAQLARAEYEEHLRMQAIKRKQAQAAIVIDKVKAKEEFEAFAKEHYYSKLTQQEKDIIKASEKRILYPDEMPIFTTLTERWQLVILEWEARPLFPIPDVEG